jgi:hypothetical protein
MAGETHIDGARARMFFTTIWRRRKNWVMISSMWVSSGYGVFHALFFFFLFHLHLTVVVLLVEGRSGAGLTLFS